MGGPQEGLVLPARGQGMRGHAMPHESVMDGRCATIPPSTSGCDDQRQVDGKLENMLMGSFQHHGKGLRCHTSPHEPATCCSGKTTQSGHATLFNCKGCFFSHRFALGKAYQCKLPVRTLVELLDRTCAHARVWRWQSSTPMPRGNPFPTKLENLK